MGTGKGLQPVPSEGKALIRDFEKGGASTSIISGKGFLSVKKEKVYKSYLALADYRISTSVAEPELRSRN
jgi:hypothetical protein